MGNDGSRGSLFLRTFSQHDATGLFVWSRDSPFLFCPARVSFLSSGWWDLARATVPGGGLNRGEKCNSMCSSDRVGGWYLREVDFWLNFFNVNRNFEPKSSLFIAKLIFRKLIYRLATVEWNVIVGNVNLTCNFESITSTYSPQLIYLTYKQIPSLLNPNVPSGLPTIILAWQMPTIRTIQTAMGSINFYQAETQPKLPTNTPNICTILFHPVIRWSKLHTNKLSSYNPPPVHTTKHPVNPTLSKLNRDRDSWKREVSWRFRRFILVE